MKIAVASGKGGTGKSTVSVNLACLLAEKTNNVALLDCDVEEPNCHIFFKPVFNHSEKIKINVPEIDTQKCISCGECVKACEFNALASIQNKILKFDDLCHGCNVCKIICPAEAITKKTRETGVLDALLKNPLYFIQGKTNIGEALSPPLIKHVKQFADKQRFRIQIIDSPPGTSCPFINTIYGVDYLVLVTEPTPFGFHDLKMAVNVAEKMKIPFGIVINKSNGNDALIENWAQKNNIRIITKIPQDIKIAQLYSKGEIIVQKRPSLKKYFQPLIDLVYEVNRD